MRVTRATAHDGVAVFVAHESGAEWLVSFSDPAPGPEDIAVEDFEVVLVDRPQPPRAPSPLGREEAGAHFYAASCMFMHS